MQSADPAATDEASAGTPAAVIPTVEATDLAEDSASGEATNASSGHATPEGGVPSSPRDVEALIVSARFITLRWKEPLVANGAIIGYSVLYRQEGSERYFLPSQFMAHCLCLTQFFINPAGIYRN